jgi:hypothetical protein
MPTLHIDHLQITILTDGGKFGCAIKFDNGLNVIRAANTSGKSSCVNSILYVLGMEAMLGKQGRQSLTPALRKELEFNNRTHKVLESYIELSVKNDKDESIRIKRQAAGNQDDRLVTVTHITTESPKQPETYYFLRDPGAAQRERGFHHFLASFLGLDLPMVDTYSGAKVPLYLDCIFPLFFIEQKRGWSDIQATIPKMYQIRNVSKVAVEYVLDLDVAANQLERRNIEIKKALIGTKWSSINSQIKGYAELLGGISSGLPSTPQALIDLDNGPVISLPINSKWLSLDDWIIAQREAIIELRAIVESTSESVTENEKYKDELELLEDQLFYLDRRLAEARNEYYQEESNIRLLNERLVVLETDLARNQDAQRLQKYGADINSTLVKGMCPTCNQEITDSLLDQSTPHVHVMSVEENIKLIQQQIQATKAILSQSAIDLDKKRQLFKSQQELVNSHRKKIQDIKTNLVQDKRLPNLALIRDLVSREEKLKTAEEVRTELANTVRELATIVEEWKAVRAREEQLPKEYFSQNDNRKLGLFTDLFRVNLINFGFRSNNPQAIELSRDTYRPKLESYELYFDASASDNIRLIWAYTLALQEVANTYKTNHINMCVFDEPGQQQIDIPSKRKFYRRMGRLDSTKNQFIVTSSDDPDLLNFLLADVSHQRIEFGDEVFKPLEE